MTAAGITRRRLANHALARASFVNPEDVVAWFGAVQAQDYLGSLWAIGLRSRGGLTEADVEDAETRRAIVRSWPMRGTLHFTAAADARWMAELLAPRVLARNAARVKREVDVDAKVIGRCRDIVARALEGGQRLERNALYAALEARRIRTGGTRGLHILGWLAMEGTVCLAGRSGKQQTFALLDDWVPAARRLERSAALAELATRYFTSHGPATQRDFAWWAGLTLADARAAIDAAGAALARETLEGHDYWWGAATRAGRAPRAPHVRLLPAFDEYTVAYENRAALVADGVRRRINPMQLLNPVVLVDGRVAGTWKRALEKHAVRVAVKPLRPLTPAERAALADETRRLGGFLGREATLQV